MSDGLLHKLIAPRFVEDEERRLSRLLNFFSAYIVAFALLAGAVRFWVGDARIPFLVSGLAVLAARGDRRRRAAPAK